MTVKRNTIQRQLVLDAVCELASHPTAEQVYEYVVDKHPSISKATVYRNLSMLSEYGELLNIGSFHGSIHYDHNCSYHCHFICENCKQVFDISTQLPNVFDDLREMHGFEIKGHSLSFNGLCPNCST
ncbi:MAG: transcriptional repressor [Coriobacteriia bacterium]|nr:transcriptional repressor [Coriobacteriia bacterium]